MNLRARHRRLGLVVLLLLGVSVATALALSAFRENLFYFYSPTRVAAGEAPRGYPFRLGGLVARGSVDRTGEGLSVRFVVTDGSARIPVVYRGVLPDLFAEGRGVVARGRLEAGGAFHAEEVLAKHDENYMPPEVAESVGLTASGGAAR